VRVIPGTRYRAAGYLLFCLLWLACGAPEKSASGHYAQYAARLERVSSASVRVLDGDTFVIRGRTIRILGIDTPETRNPEHGIPEDQPFGPEATELARKLVAGSRTVEYLPYRNDKYGRLLAHVFLDGNLYGVRIVEAGLAYETVSFYGDNGFPDLAAEITRAARKAGQPRFEEPFRWRRAHQYRP
jgi:micrococcal nuclease